MQQRTQSVRTASCVAGVVLLSFFVALPSTGATDSANDGNQITTTGVLVVPELSADIVYLTPESAPKEDVAPNPLGTPKAASIIYQEGYEGAFPGPWVLMGDGDVYWDDVSNRSYSGNWSAWCAGGGSNAQADGANYLNNMNAWMIYGPFSLADATNGSLSFWLWNHSETNYDWFSWGVSTNGTNYGVYKTSGNTSGWEYKTIDFTNVPVLGDVTGQSQVWIAFNFQTDSSNTDLGAFVDDVEIVKSSPGVTACIPSATTSCLQNNRFEVTIDYRFNNGTTGNAQVAMAGTADSGLFYYTNPNNWEFLIKILNGCTINNNYWVFFAATTNQEFTVRVRDTQTGSTKTYFNPLGQPADAVTDTQAFATCP